MSENTNTLNTHFKNHKALVSLDHLDNEQILYSKMNPKMANVIDKT